MSVKSKSQIFKILCLFAISFTLAKANVYESQRVVVIPPGYHSFPNIQVAYKVHVEQKTWHDAKLACIEEGGHLAIIDTMEKVRFVAGLKGFNVYVWVGIYRTDATGKWMTAGQNHLMPNLPWAPGKPAGTRNNCLTVRGCNRGLSNEYCSSLKGFVCEVPLTEQFADIMIH